MTSPEPPFAPPVESPAGPVGGPDGVDERPSADLFDDAPDPGPAPPVVVVMVVHDPGDWFEETLRSIAAQDYPALSVLVVDAASADAVSVRDRVGAVLPDAHLRRLNENPGYAVAADESLVAVQGASFLLFCHDDVRLAPDVVRLLVEEAFRSNAGIVGPKIVEWTDPTRLLSVGMGSDRFGHPAPYVERGDLDQEQHDAVRDVFYIPGAATLVRADLFEALGGFDPAMSFHGEDLDLCWRAHVAGARVIVTPAAVVAHLEALGRRRPVDDRRRLQARHRLRAMRASDTLGTRVRAVPEAFVLSLLEIVQAVALGHFRRARDIASAWVWNLRNGSSLRVRRRSLAPIRRVSDGEVHAFQSRGSARLSLFMRTRVARSDAAASGRALVTNLRQARTSTAFVVWLLILAFLLIGGRELVFGSVPVVGDFVRFLSPGQMFDRWTSGWQSVGLGSTAPAPTGFGALAAAGTVLLGATGFLREVLVLGLWPLGAIGMWRLARPIGSTRSRLLSTIVYVILPLAANATAQGQLGTLAAYAAFPWVLGQLVAASGLSPFRPGASGGGAGVRDRSLRHRTLAAGVVSALAATVEPTFVLFAAGAAIALVIGGWLTGRARGGGRVLLVGFGASAVSVVLLLPWSAGLIAAWDSVLGADSSGGFPLALADVLRFGTGPFGSGVIGWFLLAPAVLPLFIARSWRLAWTVRSWALAATGFGLAWAIGQGRLVDVLPPAPVLLVPAAVGVALAAGMGMAAFEVDLPDYRLGWRQVTSFVAAAAFIVSLGPSLLMTFSGRWDLPRGDYERSLSFLADGTAGGWFRVLWVGDGASIPTGSWPLDAPALEDLGGGRQLSFATTGPSTPSIAELWPGGDGGATSELVNVLQSAARDGTARLGAELAPMAVRYIVVPVAPAPDPYARSRAEVPDALLALLDSQLDLAAITVNPGVRVYRNSVWVPGATLLPAGTQLPEQSIGLADRTTARFDRSVPVLTTEQPFAEASGDLTRGGLLYAAVAGDDWRLTVDGATQPGTTALGWARAFSVDGPGAARLYFATPPLYWAMLAGQVVLWLLALVLLSRGRTRADEGVLLMEPPVPVGTAVAPVAPSAPSAAVGPVGIVAASAGMALVEATPLEAGPTVDPDGAAERSTVFDAADSQSIDAIIASLTEVTPPSSGDPTGPAPAETASAVDDEGTPPATGNDA